LECYFAGESPACLQKNFAALTNNRRAKISKMKRPNKIIMKTKCSKNQRPFLLKLLSYDHAYYAERIIELEAALAKAPRRLQIDLIGGGEIPADLALLIRSIFHQYSAATQIVTHARSSLQNGSVLVWLSGDHRLIRHDARIFFRRVEPADDDETDPNKVWKEGDLKYSDSYSEADPDEADYAKVLELINEFLPVKELVGRPIYVPLLRQFGLIENEELDHFLANAFGRSPAPGENPATEFKAKREPTKVKKTELNK
jgi:hypothetical protein